MIQRSRLPRLAEECYQGRAIGHWTFGMESRATGWLDPFFHARLRVALVHCCARYRLACPVYCLMPDHAHFLLMGLAENSDQRRAIQMLRRAFNAILPKTCVLQRQAHDHILREHERERSAFETISAYILSNPVRAGLVEKVEDWEFSGSTNAGYPSLDPKSKSFWKSFWLAYHDSIDP